MQRRLDKFSTKESNGLLFGLDLKLYEADDVFQLKRPGNSRPLFNYVCKDKFNVPVFVQDNLYLSSLLSDSLISSTDDNL